MKFTAVIFFAVAILTSTNVVAAPTPLNPSTSTSASASQESAAAAVVKPQLSSSIGSINPPLVIQQELNKRNAEALANPVAGPSPANIAKTSTSKTSTTNSRKKGIVEQPQPLKESDWQPEEGTFDEFKKSKLKKFLTGGK